MLDEWTMLSNDVKCLNLLMYGSSFSKLKIKMSTLTAINAIKYLLVFLMRQNANSPMTIITCTTRAKDRMRPIIPKAIIVKNSNLKLFLCVAARKAIIIGIVIINVFATRTPSAKCIWSRCLSKTGLLPPYFAK